jgi:redox-sensing transcriptional repressor
LPRYLRILKKERDNGLQYISSTLIAKELNLTSIQVRKDLAIVSKCDGKPGMGFEITELISDLEEFLGLNHVRKAVIVGAGRLGQALVNFRGFENNIDISIMFDNDKRKCNGKNIFHIEEMQEYIKNEKIEIAIITVPENVAQDVCDLLTESGIKAIWNFALIHLKTPKDVVVKNEDLSGSLAVLLNNFK